MKYFAKLLFAIVCQGCIANQSQVVLTEKSDSIFITEYGSFGPPQIAARLIGDNVWQWNDMDNVKPKKFDIKVVVYKGVELDKVKQSFHVSAAEKKDYRYVNYQDALDYLDTEIKNLKKILAESDGPCEAGEFYIYPMKLLETALAIERKFSD